MKIQKQPPGEIISTVRFSEGMAARMRQRLAEYEDEARAGVMHTESAIEHMQWVRDGLGEWDAAIVEQEKRERRGA